MYIRAILLVCLLLRSVYGNCDGAECDSCSACLTQQDPSFGWCGDSPLVGFCVEGNVNGPFEFPCLYWNFYICPLDIETENSTLAIPQPAARQYLPCFTESQTTLNHYVLPGNLIESGRSTIYQFSLKAKSGWGVRLAVVLMLAVSCVNPTIYPNGSIVPMKVEMQGASNYQNVSSVGPGLADDPTLIYLPLTSDGVWWTNFTQDPAVFLRLTNLNFPDVMSAIAIYQLNIQFVIFQVDPLVIDTTRMGAYCSPDIPLSSCLDTVTIAALNLMKFTYSCSFLDADGNGNYSVTAIFQTNSTIQCSLPPFGSSVFPIPTLGKPTAIFYMFMMDGWISKNPYEIGIYVFPQISELNPSNGSISEAVTVTISGDGFFSTNITVRCSTNSTEYEYYFIAQYVNPTSISFEIIGLVTDDLLTCCVSMDGTNYLPWNTSCPSYQPYIPSVPPVPEPSPEPQSAPVGNNWILWSACSAVLFVIIVVMIIYCKTSSERKKRYTRLPDIVEEEKELVKAEIKPEEIQFGEAVGSGSFSTVYRGQWQGLEVAIKVIKASEPREDLLSEAAIMVKLQHPNIVKFQGACLDPTTNLFIVTEFLPRGSLSKILSNKNYVIESEHGRKWAADTCRGMAYLHSKNIIHRDLKPANLLVTEDWSVKVADFGLSRVLHNAQLTQTLTACGTISCSAPEVLRDQRYSLKADIYSFGVCLWAIYTRKKPYPKKTDAQIVIAVAIEGKRLPIPPKTPKEITRVLKTCWQSDPKSRPSFEQLTKTFENMTLPLPNNPYPIESEFAHSGSGNLTITPSMLVASSTTGTSGGKIIQNVIITETAKLLD